MNRLKKNIFYLLLIGILIIFQNLNINAIIIDRIMAKVNNEIITQSELEEQLDSLREDLLQNYKPEEVEQVLKKQKTEILGKLVESRILLQEAKKLNVTVSDEEVEKEVKKNITQLKERFNNDDSKFLEALGKKGLNPDSLNEKLKKSVQENMIIQRLIYREIRSHLDVTESDIREYFLHIGRETHARHILIKILPDADSKQEKEAKNKIEDIYKELAGGADIKELAKKYSEDPKAQEGGDLGYFKQGDMIPEFEEVLNKLKVGEFSQPVRTRYGYNIIFLEEQKILPREEEVKARHILVKTLDEANEIKKQLDAGSSFEQIAREKSLDPLSREKGGDLGYFKKNMMIEGFGEVAYNLKLNEISDPVKTQYGYHIIQALDKRFVQYDTLHDEIKNALLQNQMESKYIIWLNNLRQKVNIEIMK